MFGEIVQESTPAGPITSVTPAAPTANPVDPFTNMPIGGYQNPLLGGAAPAQAGQGKAFIVSDLRWGTWTGLSQEQKDMLPGLLKEMGYTEDLWESTDAMERPSDAEKEQAIKCALGIQ